MLTESVRALCAHGKLSIYQCSEPWCVEAVAKGGYIDYVSFPGKPDDFKERLAEAIVAADVMNDYVASCGRGIGDDVARAMAEHIIKTMS
ncbi:MAG: hypothetical protein ABR949_10235 [Candidatus Aquilonibacter sp.]